MIATALSQAMNLYPKHGRAIMDMAFKALPPGATTISFAELGKHGIIEHEWREDIVFGDPYPLSPTIWEPSKFYLHDTNTGGNVITPRSLARARHARILSSRAKHRENGMLFPTTYTRRSSTTSKWRLFSLSSVTLRRVPRT